MAENYKRMAAGGSAFPAAYGLQDEGMTLRDYFAARAMAAIIAGEPFIADDVESPEVVSSYAYKVADAMLKARG